jgi:coenzyme F420-0:L-glutamate ligase / coenzyme F420-1:gamma-L-glutamate ligase
MIRCAESLSARALPGVPIVEPGDDLCALALTALARAAITLVDGDVLVVASKVVSRAEGRFVNLSTVDPSPRAREVAQEIGHDPRLVELILRDAEAISRKARGVLVVRHRLGFVGANASIDASNARPRDAAEGTGPWVLVLPEAPDRSAETIRAALHAQSGAKIGVVITDSLGRPFRIGTVGAAIGLAGLPATWDRRGDVDLFGRVLEQTIVGLADAVAAVADLVAGQAGEGRAFVLVRGLSFDETNDSARALCRAPEQDLYA